MEIIPESTPSTRHPHWCDARVCETVGAYSVDHRSTPMAWKSSTDDYLITTGLARFDVPSPVPGTTAARLELRDLAADDPDGTPREMGVDLTAADARLLAAALVAVAEQLEAEQRREVIR